MKILLDTHTFIWLDGKPEQLSLRAVNLIENLSNDLILSVVSVWEIAIKYQLGKLQINRSLSDLVASQQLTNDIKILPVTLTHVLRVETLLLHHKDPFDRILIAQAITEKLPILSRDRIFDDYPIERIW
jgi:PIN domain nuclease of toxin-antitoxin system